MKYTPKIGRRDFLVMTGAGSLALLTGCGSNDEAAAPRSEDIGPDHPAVARAEAARKGSGRVTSYDLTAVATTVAIGRREVSTWAYGDVIPGTALRVRQGDTLEVKLDNRPAGGHHHPLAWARDPQRHGRRARPHPAGRQAGRDVHLPVRRARFRHLLVPSAHGSPARSGLVLPADRRGQGRPGRLRRRPGGRARRLARRHRGETPRAHVREPDGDEHGRHGHGRHGSRFRRLS